MKEYIDLDDYLNNRKPKKKMLVIQSGKQQNKSYYRVNAKAFLKANGVPDEIISKLLGGKNNGRK